MKQWSLNAKIIFVLCIFILASIAISILGIRSMGEINTALNNIVDINVKRLELAQDLKSHMVSQVVNEKNFILEESKDGMQKISELQIKEHEEIEKRVEELLKVIAPAGRKNVEDFKQAYLEWWANNQEVRSASLGGDNKKAFELSNKVGRTLRFKAEGMMDQIVSRNKEMLKEESERTDREYESARNTMLTLSVLAIFIGIALAAFILHAVSKAIDQVISNLTDNSNQVTSAAQQIASSSEELSQAASEQASSLEETASSIEEMSSMVQKNAENAKRTSQIATGSKDSASKGKEVVQQMMKAIEDINTSNSNIMLQVEDSNKQISDIVRIITEIANKTKVINDIVFQTKLLSFNASVEAARAGEHGKGFAVVAEEVGNLAQMSGNAAKEISAMLEDSVKKVESTVTETKQRVEKLMLEGKEKVEAGSQIAVRCGEVLDVIVENVSSVTQMANEISTACEEQAQGVQEITKAMSQLDQVTQTNAATSEEAASAAEELSAQAESLRGVVGVLIETIKGSSKQGAVAQGEKSIDSKKKMETKAAKSNNVIAMKPKKSADMAQSAPLKKAVGFESNATVPSENDPRFEEI